MLLKDFPYKPLASEEDIEKALAFFEFPERAPEVIGTLNAVYSVANYRVVFEDGTVEDRFGAGCHAGLTRDIRGPGVSCFAFYTAPRPNGKEDPKGWEHYLWNESFASAFVLARHEKGAVVSSDIPACLLQNIAIMSRHGRELNGTGNLSFFDYLKPLIGGDLAYTLSMNSRGSYLSSSGEVGDIQNRLKETVFDQGGGHRAWNLFSLDSLKKFCSGDFGKKLDETKDMLARTHNGLYGGREYCDSVWKQYQYVSQEGIFTREAVRTYPELRERLSDFRKGLVATKGYSPPNPFKRDPTAYSAPIAKVPEDCTFEEVVTVVVPFLKEKGILP